MLGGTPVLLILFTRRVLLGKNIYLEFSSFYTDSEYSRCRKQGAPIDEKPECAAIGGKYRVLLTASRMFAN